MVDRDIEKVSAGRVGTNCVVDLDIVASMGGGLLGNCVDFARPLETLERLRVVFLRMGDMNED